MFSRFSFRSLFRRIRDFFVPDEDIEELEIEDEDEQEIDELEQRRQELEQRIEELEARERELLDDDEIPISGIDDILPDVTADELDAELDKLEAELDAIEAGQEAEPDDEIDFGFDDLTDEQRYIVESGIPIEEFRFRQDMADFFGVDVLDLQNISVEELEVLSRSFIFDDTSTGEYVGSFSTPADLVNSPLFDLLIGGYADIAIDEDGNISVYQTGTDRIRAAS